MRTGFVPCAVCCAAAPAVVLLGHQADDVVENVFFNLLQLTRPAPVTLRLYDLAGRRVATVFDEERGIGPVEVAWAGITGGGEILLPGNYVWVLEVHADAFTERHHGVVGVAY